MAEEQKTSLKTWFAVLGTMLGAFMAVLDIQITNSSLRDISGGIAATPDEGSWISTAYLIGEIITIPLTGWLSKVFTVRWYLLVNIVLFLLFSALCGFSHSLGEMIFFRAGQGFTGGVFIPMSLTVMLSVLPKNLQGVGQAIFGLTATLAPAVGPALGGWLTDKFGWEWNFFINFIPGALMFATVWFTIEAKPLQWNLLATGDWWGIGCMAIGLGSLVTVLEEGQRKDWFGSDLIIFFTVLAAIFVPAFIIIQLCRQHPLLKLSLLGERNLGFASLVGFALGLGLYGSVYIVPLYLGQVQGYSPLQIGEVLIWVGLPQLLIFPVLPLLMKKMDVRLLVCFGCLLFGLSCYLNAFMDYNFAHDQFVFTNVIRALGQPFTIVPVIGLATGLLAKEDSADGSSIFNILRNLGGSFGIAILSTIVTRREQFHDFRIGERVSTFDPIVQERLAQMQANFETRGTDPAEAMMQALRAMKQLIQREANIMAFNDAFYVVAVSLAVASLIVWLCKRPDPGKAAEAA